MKKITYTDILSATIFIPASSNWLINKLRRLLKGAFKFMGKFISVFF